MKTAFLVLLLLSLSACNKSFDTIKSIYAWINDPDNGLVKTKTVEGILLTIKYLPPELLALKETKDDKGNRAMYDSLLNEYKKSYTFLLSIASKENKLTNDP